MSAGKCPYPNCGFKGNAVTIRIHIINVHGKKGK